MIQTAFLLMALLFCSSAAWGGETFALPPLPAEEFGNIIINRNSTKNGILPVVFSHWKHRTKFTCRVCHSELDFNMKANTTEIREI